MKIDSYDLHNFLVESNAIEGEEWDEIQMEAGEFALSLVNKRVSVKDILKIHELHRKPFTNFHGGESPIKFGEFRKCNVRVGNYVAPGWRKVPRLMEEYCKDWDKMDSWEAHCRFESIHPFPDLNGRVGRLLYLSKAIENEGYLFSIPFLQKFYYSTLSHYRSK